MAEVGGCGLIIEFEIIAEHVNEMFFEAHHQRMHPGVEDDVGAFETHLWGIAGREVLHMHGR